MDSYKEYLKSRYNSIMHAECRDIVETDIRNVFKVTTREGKVEELSIEIDPSNPELGLSLVRIKSGPLVHVSRLACKSITTSIMALRNISTIEKMIFDEKSLTSKLYKLDMYEMRIQPNFAPDMLKALAIAANSPYAIDEDEIETVDHFAGSLEAVSTLCAGIIDDSSDDKKRRLAIVKVKNLRSIIGALVVIRRALDSKYHRDLELLAEFV